LAGSGQARFDKGLVKGSRSKRGDVGRPLGRHRAWWEATIEVGDVGKMKVKEECTGRSG
jgi:hypothetical protein